MKAMTVAAVATATVASNISYAQPAPVFHMPTALPGSLSYLQPEDAPQMKPALTSHLNSAQQSDASAKQSIFPQGEKKMTKMISRPKTPIEFAQNLKTIFDDDLLLQDAFYIDANLKDVFNLDDVSIFDKDNAENRRISIIASVPGSVIPLRKISEDVGGLIPGAEFVGGRTIHRSGAVTAVLNFGMYKGGPDFDTSERIFAKRFFRVPPRPSPHGGPGAATAPHGNETWRHQQINGQLEKEITVGFNSAGELCRVLIEFKNN
ncbi:hypothetical protein [Burkholderia sp. 22PA0106]|uniref:hypothetical protein n=1 Tax=Burkholderia sp. 22PA0106 TaxID=3237371 RepID=UPI0039C1F829